MAACFHCETIFNVEKIFKYLAFVDKGETALCPYCEIDSVISDQQIELDPEFIRAMRIHYFDTFVD